MSNSTAGAGLTLFILVGLLGLHSCADNPPADAPMPITQTWVPPTTTEIPIPTFASDIPPTTEPPTTAEDHYVPVPSGGGDGYCNLCPHPHFSRHGHFHL